MMRPETTITLNKASFRADEAITGFVDIDINQTVPGEWDPKLWVVKVRLVGYAQMDTQWHEQAKNPNTQERPRYETVPIEDTRMTIRSTDGPVFVKPGVPNRVRSLPFQIQLSPAQLISSFNAQKGLFLVDYLLTATARRKCPKTGWNLLKLETRTFVSITPPETPIEKPFHVTPYSPPLDDMDLFRCPFMQTIRFNYSSKLTTSAISPAHKMSLYFPLPLYEPEEISLSLTSTMTLKHSHVVNRHTDTTLLPYETYYRPDSGGEEVLIEFDIPIKTPQTMDFAFPKGAMTMSHSLRVTMQATLFPGDKSKSTKKTWTVDLPVTIRGRHYVDPPMTPPLSATTIDATSPQTQRSSLSHKPSDGPRGWIKERFDLHDDSSDEENEPTSAVSASSFATSMASSEKVTERVSLESNSSSSGSSRDTVSRAERKQLRMDTLMEMPPQKPAPTGPLPQLPEPGMPSPVLRHRLSPEQEKGKPSAERPAKKQATMADKAQLSPTRNRNPGNDRPVFRPRAGSIPGPKEAVTFYDPATYDPFLANAMPMQQSLSSPTAPPVEPVSASSVSTKSTMPPTPPSTFANVPSYYHAKPSYYLAQSAPKIVTRPRAQTTGSSSKSPISPISPLEPVPSTTTSRVKFAEPEVMMDPPHITAQRQPKPPATMEKLPFPRSPPEVDFPFKRISPPLARKNSSAPSLKSLPSISTNIPKMVSPVSPPRGPATYSGRMPMSPADHYTRLTTSRSDSGLPVTKPIAGPSSVRSEGYVRTKSNTPSQISTTSTKRVSHPMPSPTKTSPPPPPRPTARPPLPSYAKARIVSMATDTTGTTNTTAVSHHGTISTAPTSRSGMTGDSVPRAKVPRRPFALFPPLPPATLSQPSRMLGKTGLPSPISPTPSARKQGRNWI